MFPLIDNDALLAKLHEQEQEPEKFDDYMAHDFERQVEIVANAIEEYDWDHEAQYKFSFGWSGELEGVVNGGLVSIWMGDFVYLSRYVELKHLTNNREVRGVDQAFAIRDALQDAYNDLMRYVNKHHLPPQREDPRQVHESVLRVRFNPQAWQNDYAVPVDPEGPTEWRVSVETAPLLLSAWAKGDDLDFVKDDVLAPAWIAGWPGPFTIELLDVGANDGPR